LVGVNKIANIKHCYATGNVTGNSGVGDKIGGLVGTNDNTSSIEYCFATGLVTQAHGCAGGLVGQNSTTSTIANCYARGNVSGTANNIGGLVGRNTGSSIDKSYSTGTATSSGGCYGGILGSNEQNGSITSGFWDTETSGLTTACGYSDIASTILGTSGKTSSEMKTQSIFTALGWDFSTIWAIGSTDNDGYPYLAVSKTGTGLYDTKYNTNITIYPNPASDAIQVTGVEGKASLTLLDINGKLILNKEVANNEAISVSSLSQGIYLMKIVTANGTTQKKLVKK
jgi:hypothetical protein